MKKCMINLIQSSQVTEFPHRDIFPRIEVREPRPQFVDRNVIMQGEKISVGKRDCRIARLV